MNPQATWLEADLASVDRSETPWVIVAGHRNGSYPTPTSPKQSAGYASHIQRQSVFPGPRTLVLYKYQRSAPLANCVIDSKDLDKPSRP
jgi:hypothetical protein